MVVVQFKFTCDEILVDLQNLQPQLLPLSLNLVCVRPHQRLLQNLFSQYFVQILAQTYNILQALIIIDESDGHAQNLCQICEAKLLKSVASFH